MKALVLITLLYFQVACTSTHAIFNYDVSCNLKNDLFANSFSQGNFELKKTNNFTDGFDKFYLEKTYFEQIKNKKTKKIMSKYVEVKHDYKNCKLTFLVDGLTKYPMNQNVANRILNNLFTPLISTLDNKSLSNSKPTSSYIFQTRDKLMNYLSKKYPNDIKK